jgi:putative transposase
MVDADEYLLELAAYIHLNPVRARITGSPENYRWSSHRAYLGKENLPWLDTDFILSQFSSNVTKARALFATYVKARIEEQRRKEFHGEKTVDERLKAQSRDRLTFEARALAAWATL